MDNGIINQSTIGPVNNVRHVSPGICDLPSEIMTMILEEIEGVITIQRLLSINHHMRRLARGLITKILLKHGKARSMSEGGSYPEFYLIPVSLVLSLTNLRIIDAYIRIETGQELVMIVSLLPNLQSGKFYFIGLNVANSATTMIVDIVMFIEQYCHGYYPSGDSHFSLIRRHSRNLLSSSFTFAMPPLASYPENIIGLRLDRGIISPGFPLFHDDSLNYPPPLDGAPFSSYGKLLMELLALLNKTSLQHKNNHHEVRGGAQMQPRIKSFPNIDEIFIGLTIPMSYPHNSGLVALSESGFATYIHEIQIIFPRRTFLYSINLRPFYNLRKISEDPKSGHDQDVFRRVLMDTVTTLNLSAPLEELLLPVSINEVRRLMEQYPAITKFMVNIGWIISDVIRNDTSEIIRELLKFYPRLHIILHVYTTPGYNELGNNLLHLIQKLLTLSNRITYPGIKRNHCESVTEEIYQ